VSISLQPRPLELASHWLKEREGPKLLKSQGEIGMALALTNAFLGSKFGTNVWRASSTSTSSSHQCYCWPAPHRLQAAQPNDLDAYTSVSGQTSVLVLPTHSQSNVICNPSAFLLTSLSACPHLLVTGSVPNSDSPRVVALSPCS